MAVDPKRSLLLDFDEATRRRGLTIMPGTIKDFHVEGRRLVFHVKEPVAATELASEQISEIVRQAAAEVFSPRFEIAIQVVH